MDTQKTVSFLEKYVRAANYLSAAQIFLQDNFLLERQLRPEDIKPRLLGHWGTCPGVNLMYACLNALIVQHRISAMFLLGPGHGFAALQANLFMEGTLGLYDKRATQNKDGLAYIIHNFSWPHGFPSHSNPEAPGVILEGGELGYALSTAYGAVLDNPDLLVACAVGDGEAETGPTAAAWHLNKFIDPAVNGAVLPILHLNGYKISGPTIFGRMSNEELAHLFRGYGYEPILVNEGEDLIPRTMQAFEQALQLIQRIQAKARSGKTKVVSPRFPVIVLKTPKGWTGPKELHGKKIEGNCHAHQVVAKDAKTDAEELAVVESWLRSYCFQELFDAEDGFVEDVNALIPPPAFRMGNNEHAYSGRQYRPLVLPDASLFAEDATVPGTIGSSSMRRIGLYLNEVFRLNAEQKNFRLLSPDETYSNKLDDVFRTTGRAFVWPVEPWDEDMAPDGRVMEMLSEHSLQGLMQGYVLTGRHALFVSYEAFVQIIGSMVDQYAKFLRVAMDIPWRIPIPSLNYILTSSGWRQEHNGFSHQNPGFISDVLQKQGCFMRAYFPPDGNSALVAIRRCLSSVNRINIIVTGKTLEPRWLTPELAEEEAEKGIMTWDFASDSDPHIVFVAVGDYLTKESLAAIDLLKRDAPEIRIRFVNIMELSAVGVGGTECRTSFHNLNEYLTPDKPVIVNFHGYPEVMKQLLFQEKNPERFVMHGYIENGSTTTPFDMQVRNHTSRFHLAMDALRLLSDRGVIEKEKADRLTASYRNILQQHHAYIQEHGVDPKDIEQWQWSRPSGT